MAVGPTSTDPVHPVDGVRLGAIASGLRYADRLDLVLVELSESSRVSGVFTLNAFCAAPVTLAKQHLARCSSRYFLINTGCANAGTGAAGEQAAQTCCAAVAQLTETTSDEVLPFSTGVIGESLPVERLVSALPDLQRTLSSDNWQIAAQGIMTTDTRPKLASSQVVIGGKTVTVTGFAKGAGMIKPNMATMLAFIFTDADIGQSSLDTMLNDMVNQSFNRITVDGDTSTNDSCMLVATGRSGVHIDELSLEHKAQFLDAIQTVFLSLATELIKDAEGATKFITIRICGGANSKECLQAGYAIAESPLVKTAFFASDPNWGRILAAVGRAGISGLDLKLVQIQLGEVSLVVNGGLAHDYTEERGQSEMDKDEIDITVNLGRGESEERIWTSDLSNEYIRINAEYRT